MELTRSIFQVNTRTNSELMASTWQQLGNIAAAAVPIDLLRDGKQLAAPVLFYRQLRT